MKYATYTTYISSVKEAGFSLPQLGVSFLGYSNSWNVNGTRNVRTVRQMLRNTEPASFWHCSWTA